MKNLLKKLLAFSTCALMVFSVAACGGKKAEKGDTCDGDFIALPNAKGDLIEYNQLDGIGTATPMKAAVTFQAEAFDPEDFYGEQHIRYQVTYLSCTCRKNVFNLWQTIYVELTVDAGVLDDFDTSEIRMISYDEPVFSDNAHHENVGGFWGDSPIFDQSTANKWSTTATTTAADKVSSSKDTLRTEVVDGVLEGKTYGTIKNWGTSFKEITDFQTTTVERYDSTVTEGQAAQDVSLVDAYTGASVSINNMISVLKALFAFHQTKVEEIKSNPVKMLYFEE